MLRVTSKVYKQFIFTILLIVFLSFYGFTQKGEIGFLPIKNFSPNELKALPQNWAIIEDNRGIIYIGNKEGLLEFDGTTWRKIRIRAEYDVRSLAIDDLGRIYVGSVGEFGYMQPNNIGDLEYVSLKKYIKNEYQEFDDVWKTFYLNGKVYFQTSGKLFCLIGDTIYSWNAKTEFHNSFAVNNNLYLTQTDIGLTKLQGKDIILPSGGEEFADKKLYILLPYIESNHMFAVTNDNGAFVINDQQDQFKIQQFKLDIDDILLDYQVYHGTLLPNNYISIGTFEGAEIITHLGKVKYWLNQNMGLADDNIKFQYVDRQNNLWFALSNGLSRVEINSPIMMFDKRSNVKGTIESITRVDGKLFIASSVGAFYLNKVLPIKHKPSEFLPIENINNETWIVKPIITKSEQILLVEANEDIYEVDLITMKGKSILHDYPWAIHQSKLDENLVFIGLEEGVTSLYRENSSWISKENLNGIDLLIKDIAEDNSGNLWLGNPENGIFKLNYKIENKSIVSNELNFYDTLHGLPEGPYIPFSFDNKTIVGTGSGLYIYDSIMDKFIPDTSLENAFGIKNRYIYFISIDYEKNLWMNTYIANENRDEIGYFSGIEDGKITWNALPFKGNISGLINTIYHDKDGITWFGGTEGLFRYNSKIQKEYTKKYYTLIRQVRLDQDSIIFNGTFFDETGYVSTSQPEQLKYVLPYKYNSLIFEYSAQNIDIGHPTKYSYFLNGYDKKWSEWTEETKKEYTNLPEGEYVFRVKAKNAYDNIGVEADYEFSIDPPWYRTIVAYIGYILGLVGFIYLIVTQYTKYLRQIIKENTAEIRAQKEEIEEQKEEITDSIRYAQRIQKAISPSPERAKEILPEHFVLWRPRDIVSGDYWWMTEKNGQVAIVAADCTGHGVPGAFMSMLGISFLNEIVNKMDEMIASEILNQLRASVKTTLKQTGKEGEQKDGMDLALVILDIDNMKIQYAGAYNPLYLYRNGELIETKADKNPIGIFIKELDSFTNHEIEIQKGDTFYTFSDGFPDQFGGEKGGKFKTKRFKQLLADIQPLPMKDQREMLDQTIDQWRGDIHQVDDIIVVGIRV